ncbi:unnamed protein product [Didymodactylos carnosus]|uniref:N-acetyltransferase domain-containing protein n=1 Tax=Didymodactylos carnosus TaxID=1234261 RepID=A0A8S2U5A3_9BILA|nr:unnamed protein product [Didymodactylos carnosus]CAF4315869.1 unnamed protein product [Didymodactylos carnosus]
MLLSDPPSIRRFDDQLKTHPVTIPSYLGRFILRTHKEDDTSVLASIFSDPITMKHLPFLQPPGGWGDDEKRKKEKQWTEQDIAERVKVHNQTRSNGKSCVLNIILLASKSGEKEDRCIGVSGYVTIDDETGYLGIIIDHKMTRMGYATEALYTSIVFAFEKLGIRKIVIQTGEANEEMRGWCEKTAGLKLAWKKEIQINGYPHTECGYTFTVDEWESSVKQKLEAKMRVEFAGRTFHSTRRDN